MRVAILSAEAIPFSKTGGLADVCGAMPKALRRHGVDSVLITPFYQQTKPDLVSGVVFDDLDVDWRGKGYRCRVLYSDVADAPTFLIDAPEYFFRSSIYGFREDYLRFAFFCRAAIALLKRLGKSPDIVHLNDWHTGFAAVEIAHLRSFDAFWKNTKTVFSIHNLAYQGAFDPDELWKLGFGQQWQTNAFMSNGVASSMKAGLAVSDMLSTVSRRYSYEIQAAENGYGLDWLLRQRSDRLFGVTNGVDYDEWNPENDSELPAHFNAHNLTGKRMCKDALLDKFFLPKHLDRPVLAWISRLTSQKGFSLLQETIGDIIYQTGCYFVALGSGDERYEAFLQHLRDVFPYQVGIFKGYSEPLAHLIEAGSDIFLMPSQFEPCGLNQMYSLRYGTIPVVRAVGGLDDTVQEFDRLSERGNGFKFKNYNSEELSEKIYEAIYCYNEPEIWRKMQWNGMSEDNSWEKAARNYIQLYEMAKI